MDPSVLECRVDALIALEAHENRPDYFGDAGLVAKDALLMRHWGPDPGDCAFIHIWEVADFPHDRFVWSLSVPIDKFRQTPEGDLDLEGKYMPSGCSRDYVENIIDTSYSSIGRVYLLECNFRKKGWHIRLRK
ncbi:hypothetical protein ACHAQJ_005839 [Trichoderma viride]